MSIAPYIKEIGRGKDGARSLTVEHAHDLMSKVLTGAVTDLEVGAFVMAMRIKGETTPELEGFLAAVHERCMPPAPTRPIVVLPSYNGARKLPNLTALLALLLAQQGVPVLVHGPATVSARVSTGEIFEALGLPVAQDAAEIEQAWSQRRPVFVTTATVCPELARLLDVRHVIGVRNPGHTVAKLLDPTQGGAALRVVSYTHPEYARTQAEFLQHSGANAVLLRGTEGEPVADPRRRPKLDVFVQGVPRPDLSLSAHEGALTSLPVLPQAIDATTTAHYIQSVISGEQPAPEPLLEQVRCIQHTLAAMQPQVGH